MIHFWVSSQLAGAHHTSGLNTDQCRNNEYANILITVTQSQQMISGVHNLDITDNWSRIRRATDAKIGPHVLLCLCN